MTVLRDRLLRDGYAGLAVAFLALRLLQVRPWDQSVDAYAYWATRDGSLYDAQTAGSIGAYLYSPAFAQVLAPLTWLPWAVFVTLWTGVNLAIVWWLLRRWSLPAMLFLPIPFEIISGNVHLMYAAAIVLGFRYSATWALPILTKVSPGIGVLWYAVRREWRSLGITLVVTAGISGVSWLLDPAAWRAWIDILAGSSSTPVTVGWYLPVPLLPRLAVAAALAAWGALGDRRWTVPIAVTLALPVLWLNGLAVLVALVPILWPDAGRRAARAGSAPPAHAAGTAGGA